MVISIHVEFESRIEKFRGKWSNLFDFEWILDDFPFYGILKIDSWRWIDSQNSSRISNL